MATKRRSQPYRVDWHQPAKTIEDLNRRLSKLWTDADEMFQILFDDLQAADTTINNNATSSGSGSGLGISNAIPGRDGDDGIDGATIIVSGNGGSGSVSAASVSAVGYWSPLTNGDITWPEIVFANGDTIAVWTPTP